MLFISGFELYSRWVPLPRMQMYLRPFAHDAVVFDSLLTSVKLPRQECRNIPHFTNLICIIIF